MIVDDMEEEMDTMKSKRRNQAKGGLNVRSGK